MRVPIGNAKACDTRRMDLPLIGTVDLTPSGLFLIFAVLLALGYIVWRFLDARRKARKASTDGGGAEEGEGRES